MIEYRVISWHKTFGQRIASLLAIALLTAFPSESLTADQRVKPRDPLKFKKEIDDFLKLDQTAAIPTNAILFIGSSSIRLWKTLEIDFPSHRVINRGFGGSEILDSVTFADKIVFPYRPRQILIYAGGNDINAGNTPEQVVSDFKSFVALVHTKLPATKIAFISIAGNPARWKQIDRVRRANALVQDYVKSDHRLSFVDVHSKMLKPDGLPIPEIFTQDNLHMNEKGYALWREIIAPHLAQADKSPSTR